MQVSVLSATEDLTSMSFVCYLLSRVIDSLVIACIAFLVNIYCTLFIFYYWLKMQKFILPCTVTVCRVIFSKLSDKELWIGELIADYMKQCINVLVY